MVHFPNLEGISFISHAFQKFHAQFVFLASLAILLFAVIIIQPNLQKQKAEFNSGKLQQLQRWIKDFTPGAKQIAPHPTAFENFVKFKKLGPTTKEYVWPHKSTSMYANRGFLKFRLNWQTWQMVTHLSIIIGVGCLISVIFCIHIFSVWQKYQANLPPELQFLKTSSCLADNHQIRNLSTLGHYIQIQLLEMNKYYFENKYIIFKNFLTNNVIKQSGNIQQGYNSPFSLFEV